MSASTTRLVSEQDLLVVVSVVLVVLLGAMFAATRLVLRSNRALGERYTELRDETIDAWKVYLQSEHQRMLSETAATVARVNAVARTLMRTNLDPDLVAALTER